MKPVKECTDEELTKRITFGDRIIRDAGGLPTRLQGQYDDAKQEQLARGLKDDTKV